MSSGDAWNKEASRGLHNFLLNLSLAGRGYVEFYDIFQIQSRGDESLFYYETTYKGTHILIDAYNDSSSEVSVFFTSTDNYDTAFYLRKDFPVSSDEEVSDVYEKCISEATSIIDSMVRSVCIFAAENYMASRPDGPFPPPLDLFPDGYTEQDVKNGMQEWNAIRLARGSAGQEVSL